MAQQTQEIKEQQKQNDGDDDAHSKSKRDECDDYEFIFDNYEFECQSSIDPFASF